VEARKYGLSRFLVPGAGYWHKHCLWIYQAMAKSLPSIKDWEKTMRNIKNWIALGAFSLLILGIPAIANAQWRDRDRDWDRDDRYDNRNRGYNAGYGNYGNMSYLVRSLKDRTRDFVRQLDRDLDRSRVNGTRREDQINAQAKHFRNAVNRINSNNNNWGRRDNNVERALQMGAQLDRSISRVRLSYQSQALWQGISRDLQMLGNGYGYDTRNNRGNRGGGGWNSGRMPSWWPF
jgi:hypothetical protein